MNKESMMMKSKWIVALMLLGGLSWAEAPADATTTPKAPLTTRKEKKKACGRKPLNKTKKAEWQKCVDAGGTASFEGSDFDQFENDYIDFEGEVDNQFMYSDFDNSLNLDL